MFEQVTWGMVGMVGLYVLIGLLLRTFGPYCRVAYDLIKETNQWKLPRFEPKYLLPPVATLGVYVLGVLTAEDALLSMTRLHPTVIVLSAYLGEDVIRRGIRSLTGK